MVIDNRIEVYQERQFCGGMLSIETTYRLMITGDCSLKEIDRLIRILRVQKEILEEEETLLVPADFAPMGA